MSTQDPSLDSGSSHHERPDPPGWYPDPDPGYLGTDRYWDGTAWTHRLHVRNGETEHVRPMEGSRYVAEPPKSGSYAVAIFVVILILGLLLFTACMGVIGAIGGAANGGL